MSEIKFRYMNEIGNMVFLTLWNVNPSLKKKNLKKGTELMQFVGLKDKNGKEIFGGDIVKLFCDGEEIICKVKREETYYTLDGGILGAGELQTENIEVIGNIYKNPELLNDKEFETEEDYIKLHKRQAFGK